MELDSGSRSANYQKHDYWFLWIQPPNPCCKRGLFMYVGTEWLWKAWNCHLQKWKKQPEILVDPVWAAKRIKYHYCESVWNIGETHNGKDLSLGCQGSKRLLLKWIFRWFSLLAEEIGVFPLSLFSLFLAQLIVFMCLQNHISASSCLFLRSLACCVLLFLPKTFSSPGSQLADNTVEVGRPILPLQRSDLVSGVQAHLRGEGERLYKIYGRTHAVCLACAHLVHQC